MKKNKYFVTDASHPNHAKTFKGIEKGSKIIDCKTGEEYDRFQLRKQERKSALFFGIHGKRRGVFLFVREYLKYRSFQFGLVIDFLGEEDKHWDVEIRLACFGIGIRYTKLKK